MKEKHVRQNHYGYKWNCERKCSRLSSLFLIAWFRGSYVIDTSNNLSDLHFTLEMYILHILYYDQLELIKLNLLTTGIHFNIEYIFLL